LLTWLAVGRARSLPRCLDPWEAENGFIQGGLHGSDPPSSMSKARMPLGHAGFPAALLSVRGETLAPLPPHHLQFPSVLAGVLVSGGRASPAEQTTGAEAALAHLFSANLTCKT